MYKLSGNNIIRISDGAYIPNDHRNRDHRRYKSWLKQGNQPEPEFTQEELTAKKEFAIKMKESEIVNVQGQFDIATEKGLAIAADYDTQLKKIEKELADLKK